MITRSECLFEENIIGIESIYTVIDGKQINIPEKVESLRQKGRDGLLLCPCGCGAKLILVAGDKHLREQHFRVKDGTGYKKCTLKQEGQVSIDSKVVIKCWLSDKLSNDVETRVLLNEISLNDRRYEISHIVKNNRIGVNYTYLRTNLDDRKLEEIDKSLGEYKIYHVVDFDNFYTYGQYPEFMMKIQKRQKYCLFLTAEDREYSKAKMVASFYSKNLDGIYINTLIAEGNLSDYSFNKDNELLYKDTLLNNLLVDKKNQLEKNLELEKNERDKKAKYLEELRIKNVKMHLEEIKKEQILLESEEKYRRIQEVNERRKEEMFAKEVQQDQERIEKEEEQKIKFELSDKECREKAEKEIDSYITERYTDVLGRNWYKCEICGKVGTMKDFAFFGGVNKAARGTCNECVGKKISNIDFELGTRKNKMNDNFCPLCGCELVKRKGQYGEFLGCSSFPNCRYTRKL